MILIIAAMPEEYQELETLLDNEIEDSIKGVKYHIGTLANKEVMLLLSGVGKVNTAYNLTTILNNFDISFIVNIGSAGGLIDNYSPKVLDIVVAKEVCYHDVDITPFRPLGAFGGLPLYYPTAVNDKMISALNKLELNYHYATIASGDKFIRKASDIEFIKKNFNNVCAVEMEAGAIAHISYMREIPFVVFRSISDVVNHNEVNPLQFDEYIVKASKNSALAAKTIIEEI